MQTAPEPASHHGSEAVCTNGETRGHRVPLALPVTDHCAGYAAIVVKQLLQSALLQHNGARCTRLLYQFVIEYSSGD
jgi:hypothetical protein